MRLRNTAYGLLESFHHMHSLSFAKANASGFLGSFVFVQQQHIMHLANCAVGYHREGFHPSTSW